MDFEWDETKAHSNLKKHGVSFDEASTAFYDSEARIIEDPDHSKDEERFVLIGLSLLARVLVVCHCLRGDGGTIRIISARRATPREEATYWRYRHA